MPSSPPPPTPAATATTTTTTTVTEAVPDPATPFPETASLTTVRSEHQDAHAQPSRREYLDSLVPPSREEFAHIADVQTEREAEIKRRSRELKRLSASSYGGSDVSGGDQQRQPSRDGKTSHSRGGSGSRFLHGRLFGHSRRVSASDEGVRNEAATLIQRTYRGYRARREIQGLGIDASTRWILAVREAQWRELNRPRARLTSDASGGDTASVLALDGGGSGGGALGSRSPTARHNWKKAAVIAKRAGNDADADDSDSDTSSSSSSSSSSDSGRKTRSKEQKKLAKKRHEEAKERRRKEAKTMGLQYFLEMIDLKHRYGSNLKVYHEEWQKADTNENFFVWLDYGEGRLLDIEACPRERLEREQVRYLSREERQYYLVKVDEKGRLCWAKNGVRIDTTEKWKDSIHGIVPADDTTPAYRPVSDSAAQTRLLGDTSTGSDGSSDSDQESEEEAARANRYATPAFDGAKGVKKIKHVSASTLFNQLLRKSVRKNTWIFVADTSFRLYVGIKNSGAFQHSSFLQGSRISAAGLIKIKDGRLSSLSPLSGHYRPPAASFRSFVKGLKEEGVDMSRVSISKSYGVLVGLEAYAKVTSKGKKVMRKLAHGKEKIVAPEEYKKRKETEAADAEDKSESAAREREVLAKQAEEEEMRQENKTAVQVIQKLGIRPREPKGQKGEGDVGEAGATADARTGA